MLDHTGLWQIAGLDRPDLKLAPYSPVVPPRLAPPDEDEPADVFAAIRAGDILVHHPYESFAASTQRFIAQAAADPEVLSIKMTLYRTSGDSPIVRDLISAAERGKQVVVLVEIKARFDERRTSSGPASSSRPAPTSSTAWSASRPTPRRALVVRREGSTLRRYVHIGTGNYNPGTARLYTDLGLLSCRPELGADVSDLFNVLTGLSRQRDFRRLIVAPMNLRNWILAMIERETEPRPRRPAGPHRPQAQLAGRSRPASPPCTPHRQAGVQVDLIIRGICSLWPGLPGVSEGIRVRSIVGQYLEHSRVFSFANGGRPEWYIGSADLMERNLDRRVEAIVPIEDPEAQQQDPIDVLEIMLADDRRSWQLGADGAYHRTEELTGVPGTIDTFETLKERAIAAVAACGGRAPQRPHAGRGLARSEGIVSTSGERLDGHGAQDRSRDEVPGRVAGRRATATWWRPSWARSSPPARSASVRSRIATSTRPTGPWLGRASRPAAQDRARDRDQPQGQAAPERPAAAARGDRGPGRPGRAAGGWPASQARRDPRALRRRTAGGAADDPPAASCPPARRPVRRRPTSASTRSRCWSTAELSTASRSSRWS